MRTSTLEERESRALQCAVELLAGRAAFGEGVAPLRGDGGNQDDDDCDDHQAQLQMNQGLVQPIMVRYRDRPQAVRRIPKGDHREYGHRERSAGQCEPDRGPDEE